MSKYDQVLRPFVAMMERELHANAGKGDRPGWLAMSADTCLLEIFYHLGKLQKAVKKSEGDGIGEYAADVANMCMMLADICGVLALTDPVPPAGGEVGALIDQLDDYIARINGDDRGSDATVNELRGHVTRLQAEVKRLDLMVSQADYNYDEDRAQFQRQATELQSELTKARELIDSLIGHPQTVINNRMRTKALDFLSNQSAPADKGCDEWHMNPCKQGHRDVGAAGGVAHCYTCDEKIEAATTQEAFERWNATHQAEQPAPVAVAPDFKMIGTEPIPPMEYDEP